MEKQQPIFPKGTLLINSSVGILKKDGFVNILHNGTPIFSNLENNTVEIQHIIAKISICKLCLPSELSAAFGISLADIEGFTQNFMRSSANLNEPYFTPQQAQQ